MRIARPAARARPLLISALCVTRADALPRLVASFTDLAGQRGVACELVVVHDGDESFHAAVELLAKRSALAATIERSEPGRPLGELRNRSVALARGDLVAQWDDDDRHHPERLARQAAALTASGASFAFLTDQLHWFPSHGTLYWEDWSVEAYPIDFVQGTLVGRRDRMPAYPAARRGEDTALCRAIAEADEPIARVRDAGWSYVYTWHGDNAWSGRHHLAMAQAKHLSDARILAREGTLRRRLAEYAPPIDPVIVPCGVAPIEIG
ncbi:MAG: glycosyltransferase family A protein [Betaproteobacteria bacterium]